MPRVSQEQAAKHREEIIHAAAKLFREKGIDGVSVPELMESVGLTHGGFYKQFASKDELMSLALGEAFRQSHELGKKLRRDHDNDPAATLQSYIDFYLSPQHRADPGHGCPNASLCTEIGRAPRKDPIHSDYASHLDRAMDNLSQLMPSRDPDEARRQALAAQALLVGAMVMARAAQGHPISDEILEAARASLQAE
ncbi:MAG TPA: TetR/AcrR family transcriptional regulator [Terriglobales bacterium]|nr:TetR/AcrR family transcriptional regulator [Terriglobales bacterium]